MDKNQTTTGSALTGTAPASNTPAGTLTGSGSGTSGTSSVSTGERDTHDTIEQVKSDAREGAEEVKAKAGELATQAKAKASEAMEQTRQKAGEIAGKAKDQLRNQVTERKDTAASTLDDFANALRRAGDEVSNGDGKGGNGGMVSDYTQAAAEQVTRLSGYLRDRDLDQMLQDTQEFARRQPTLFLGGAFLLGVVAARFLKSSQRQLSESNEFGQDGDQYATSYSNRSPGRAYGSDVDQYSTASADIAAHNYVPGGVAGSGEARTTPAR